MKNIPEMCLAVMTAMHESKPLWRGFGGEFDQKALGLHSHDVARIVGILSNRKKKETGWYLMCINTFAPDQHEIFLQNDVARDRCSLESLGIAYRQSMKDVMGDWKKSDAAHFPDICEVRDPKKFLLFTKRGEKSEDTLIRFLASYFSVYDDICCDSTWKANTHSGHEWRTHLYWWIRKTAYDRVARVFDFSYYNFAE